MAIKKLHQVHPEYRNLNIKSLTILLSNSILGKLKPGKVLFKENQKKDTNLYFILSGSISISKNSSEIGKLGIGSGIGEEMVFASDWKKYELGEYKNDFTVKALTDTFLLECTREDWEGIKGQFEEEELDLDFELVEKNM